MENESIEARDLGIRQAASPADGSAEVALLVGAAESVWAGSKAAVTIQIDISEKLKSMMKSMGVCSLDAVFITDSDIRHIMKGHSRFEESRGQLDVGPTDFAVLPRVLNDFDSLECSGADKLGNRKFLLIEQVGDVYYVVTVQRGARKLEVKTMWKMPGASC